jgi:integrase
MYSNWRQRIWVPACREIGRPELGYHDLRRANATGLVAEGVDIKTAQERLGHSDPRLTLAVYAQATTEADRRAADALGDRFMTPRTGSERTSAGNTREQRKRPGPEQLGLGL